MSDSFFATLTDEEQLVFKLYKNNSDFETQQFFCDHLNALLRQKTALTGPWDKAATLLKGITTKWRCPEESILYRATFADLVDPYVTDSVYCYPAFSSTTEDLELVWRHWANPNPAREPVLLTIRCPPLSEMAPLETSSTLPEGEFLLGPGQPFRILKRLEIRGSEMISTMRNYSKQYERLIHYELAMIQPTDPSPIIAL